MKHGAPGESMKSVQAVKRMDRLASRPALSTSLLVALFSLALPCLPISCGLLGCARLLAQDEPPESSPNLARGEYFMKAGKYLKASHAFRAAVLEDQTDPKRLLSFAASLFAVGNYHYSSHAIRRAARQVDGREPFRPNIVAMFPSRVAYMRALDELKRYVTYNRRDPSALTVLALCYHDEADGPMTQRILGYLRLLDAEDSFVSFLDQRNRIRLPEARPDSRPDPKPEVLTPGPSPELPKPAPEPTPKPEAEPVPAAPLTPPTLPETGSVPEQVRPSTMPRRPAVSD